MHLSEPRYGSLNLLLEIQKQLGTALVFIAHDLSVVRFFSDYVAVMYLGQVCEYGSAEAIYVPPACGLPVSHAMPRHPGVGLAGRREWALYLMSYSPG